MSDKQKHDGPEFEDGPEFDGWYDRMQIPVSYPDLSLYRLRSANTDRAVEWRKGKPASGVPLSFSMNELTGEVGELANMIKKVERFTFGLKGGKPYHELEGDIVDELADVLICVDLLGMKLGIDLASAVREKFNKTSDKYELSVKL